MRRTERGVKSNPARVGAERIEETVDPELAIDRAFETYLKKGYTKEWIHQRLLSIRIRNDLTAEWDSRGVKKGVEYAMLTDEITKAWTGMTTRQYKSYKGLKKENLRDNMSNLERNRSEIGPSRADAEKRRRLRQRHRADGRDGKRRKRGRNGIRYAKAAGIAKARRFSARL